MTEQQGGNPRDDLRRQSDWHGMARVMNVEAALQHMRAPAGQGSFTLRVADPQLAQNNAVFRVEYSGGETLAQPSQAEPDMAVTIQALARLLLGTVSLDEPSAALLPGLELYNPRAELLRAFPRKAMLISEYF